MPADRDTTLAGGIVPNRGAMVNRAINLDGYLSGSISATYSMALKPICSNLNLTLGLNYNRTPSIYGGVHNMARINSGNVRIGLTSNISERVDFNLYTNTAFNYTANTARRNTTFMTENLSYSLNWIIGRGWVFNTLLAWKYYGSSSSQRLNRIHQFPVNAGIGKKFLSRRNGELRIALYDILDRSRNLLHYIRDNSIQDDETNTVGRYLMARFSYRFNSMAHGKK
jgi:hypothetical protein